jgi:hypothetical protein
VAHTHRLDRWILGVCLVGGVLLAMIGARYFLTPEGAARTFGVPVRPAGYELYYIIGLRNVWLGLLAVAFALLREWRALALWLGFGAVVCFADAGVVVSSTGRVPQIAFHIACGVACLGLSVLTWRRHNKNS